VIGCSHSDCTVLCEFPDKSSLAIPRSFSPTTHVWICVSVMKERVAAWIRNVNHAEHIG
jgi:hypothetical protein